MHSMTIGSGVAAWTDEALEPLAVRSCADDAAADGAAAGGGRALSRFTSSSCCLQGAAEGSLYSTQGHVACIAELRATKGDSNSLASRRLPLICLLPMTDGHNEAD